MACPTNQTESLDGSTQYAGKDIPLTLNLKASDSNSLVGTHLSIVVKKEGEVILLLSTDATLLAAQPVTVTTGEITKTAESSGAIAATAVIPKTFTALYPSTTLYFGIDVILPNLVERTIKTGSFRLRSW